MEQNGRETIIAKDKSCATQTVYPAYTFYDADSTNQWTKEEALR